VGNKPLKNVLEETIIFSEKTEKSIATGAQQKVEPYLIQLSGRETGQNYGLSGRTVKIGRDATCEICVDDPHVSRVHAVVAMMNGELCIRDLESTNGVFVNGNKIKEHRLVDGDKVLVGTRLYFRFAYQDAHDQNYQQSLFRAANIDALTQLYNKKYFLDVLPKEMSFSRRANENLSLMMIDVDHFKKVNDTYGHLAGDMVLKAVGAHLAKHVRLENVACRYGGEEFAVILRNCSPELAHTVSERLRISIETERVKFREQELKITVSIGIATYINECFATIEDFIQQADEFLYEAKRTGRNKTITASHRADTTEK
jgi:two-component system, cell cycle response regulator